jgi:tektin-3
MLALLKEIHALKLSCDQLHAKLKDMESTMSQLMKTKASLEHDIKMKDVALFLDREKCLTLRQNFPMSTFKETRFPKTLGNNGMPDSKLMR